VYNNIGAHIVFAVQAKARVIYGRVRLPCQSF
jgi:hypothetical protein